MAISGTNKFYTGFSWLMLVLLASLLASCGSSASSPTPGALSTPTTAPVSSRVAIGATAPDFTVQTIEGQPLQISALKGKALIVNFWAVY